MEFKQLPIAEEISYNIESGDLNFFYVGTNYM